MEIDLLRKNACPKPITSRSRYLMYEGQVAVFHSRRINFSTDKIEIWECRWTNPEDGDPKKEFVRKVADEGELTSGHGQYSTAEAICWAPNSTIGNIAVSNKELLGIFARQDSGSDAILPCQIIPCGKYRVGSERWYCKTHQTHWGTKADIEAAKKAPNNEIECSSRYLKMNYVCKPLEVEFKDFEEIGIWCSMPPAISSKSVTPRTPKIHVHRRKKGQSVKDIDRDFDALVLSYSPETGLFANEQITQIQVIPPSALDFVTALEKNIELECVSCKKCGHPHLDLGDFARKPHKKHYCGNCGNDSVISKSKIISTPLKPIHDQFHMSKTFVEPDRIINLDDHQGLAFDIWASTPAIVWTADRPQEKGIHVHVYKDGNYLVDDTFSEVVYQGKKLSRLDLWDKMILNLKSA